MGPSMAPNKVSARDHNRTLIWVLVEVLVLVLIWVLELLASINFWSRMIHYKKTSRLTLTEFSIQVTTNNKSQKKYNSS